MKIGSVFSGLGSMDLACRLFWNGTISWFCEQNSFAKRVLRRNHTGTLPIYDDVTTLVEDGAEPVDVLVGGPPCVDLSVVQANRVGLAGDRSGLFFDFVRAAEVLRPELVVVENVPALLHEWRGVVEDAFRGAGYGVRWAVVSAGDVDGCPIQRQRVFVLATRGGRHDGVHEARPLLSSPCWPAPAAGVFADAESWAGSDARAARRGLKSTIPTGLAVRPRNAPHDPQMRQSAAWVEVLMGLPVGWTDPDRDSDLTAEAERLARSPRWPAPRLPGLWGESPQHGWEPRRLVDKDEGGADRKRRLRLLGNCCPPQQYLLALERLQRPPRQQMLFG